LPSPFNTPLAVILAYLDVSVGWTWLPLDHAVDVPGDAVPSITGLDVEAEGIVGAEGIVTVCVLAEVILPLESTVTYGTLKESPKSGVALADKPYEPDVTPESCNWE